MKIDGTEKYSKFIIIYLIFRKLEIPTEIVDVFSIKDPIKSDINHHHVFNVISDAINVSHDHFGNLCRTSRMTTEKSIQNESQIENRHNL